MSSSRKLSRRSPSVVPTSSMDQLFDLSLIEAVYSENPDLKTLPS